MLNIFSFLPTKTLFSWLNRICKLYNKRGTKYVDTIMLPHYAKQGIHLFESELVKTTYEVEFEYTTVSIAKGNDTFLRRQYGDYMQLPPVEERGLHHDTTVFYDPYHHYSYWVGKPALDKFFG